MDAGAGPPLVLLHGLGDSHRTWHFVVPLLARHFRVLAPDLPGHGFSARPDAPYTLDWYADTIASWMDAVGVDRAHICGHSYGGGIAQWMLLKYARRIDHLALLSPGGLGPEVGLALRLGAARIFSPLLAPRLLAVGTRFLMPRASRSFATRGAREIAWLARRNGAPNTGLAFRRTLSACVGLNGQRIQTWDCLGDIPFLPPMGLFWGARDWIVPVKHAREAKRRLANVVIHVYPRSGHFVHLEEPAALTADLTRFLEYSTEPCLRALPEVNRPRPTLSPTWRPWGSMNEPSVVAFGAR